MAEPVKKRVDESWKEQAQREKQEVNAPASQQTPQQAPQQTPQQAPAQEPQPHEESGESLQAKFDLFVSSLAMEALIALGDMPHPTTRKQAVNLPQAKYLIDLLGVLEEKTKGNLLAEEERLLKDALYQLRMRYLSKAGPS
jgi:hypothetical protein